MAQATEETHRTACILCSENCGLKITTKDGRFTRIVGDDDHPASAGYICQKAARLDHYQNHADRLQTPLRRREDGTFEEIGWDEAVREIADRLVSLRDAHGGDCFAYYGGGGQGNHLGGIYGASLRAAMGSRFVYTALGQEKTGDFWVNGKLFGRQTCHVSCEPEHADCVMFIGTNPWQAHGIPQARKVLKAIADDPNRTMIVIDPRVTETAAMADLHLQLRPSTDAFLLTAILAVLVQEDLVDHTFLRDRTTGYDALARVLRAVPVDAHADKSGVPVEDVRRAARMLAGAKRACVRADLGLQQSLHSTLNSYLEKLLFLLTGNFAKEGGNNLHTFFLPLVGHTDDERAPTTSITEVREIARMYPPNVLPKEIDSDRHERIRAVVVDSANPAMSGADAHAYARAFGKLELLVVIDVALTETAQLAHYVLPAASQFEKWEATFFNLGFPTNSFHLRAPILPRFANTLAEPEIYRRLCVAMKAMPERMPILALIAALDRRMPALRLFPLALAATFKLRPKLAKVAPLVLYETLGRALPDGAAVASVLWAAAHKYVEKNADAVRRTGLKGRGAALGEALFARLLNSRSGAVLSQHVHDDVWSMIRHEDRRVHLVIDELVPQIEALVAEPAPTGTAERPLVLIAGERRAYNANTIYRDPAWRRNDRDGALRMHPDDARELGLVDGAWARCESDAGAVDVRVEISDRSARGVVSLPHGYGLGHPEASGARVATGPSINRLTRSDHCDPFTAVPYHKFVPVRVVPA